MGGEPTDFFDHVAEHGLDGDYQYEVLIDKSYAAKRSYEENVQEFRDEVNAFMEEHNVVHSEIRICNYKSSGIVHEAWMLYEVDDSE